MRDIAGEVLELLEIARCRLLSCCNPNGEVCIKCRKVITAIDALRAKFPAQGEIGQHDLDPDGKLLPGQRRSEQGEDIETAAEAEADRLGIYGVGPNATGSEGDHPEDCKCRMCFVHDCITRNTPSPDPAKLPRRCKVCGAEFEADEWEDYEANGWHFLNGSHCAMCAEKCTGELEAFDRRKG